MADTQIEQKKIVALPAIVDLDALDTIRDELLESLDIGSITVDAAKVERIATNALLMLISAGQTAKQDDVDFSIIKPSEPMLGAIERLGLNEGFTSLIKG